MSSLILPRIWWPSYRQVECPSATDRQAMLYLLCQVPDEAVFYGEGMKWIRTRAEVVTPTKECEAPHLIFLYKWFQQYAKPRAPKALYVLPLKEEDSILCWGWVFPMGEPAYGAVCLYTRLQPRMVEQARKRYEEIAQRKSLIVRGTTLSKLWHRRDETGQLRIRQSK